jgi:hypothetical protein
MSKAPAVSEGLFETRGPGKNRSFVDAVDERGNVLITLTLTGLIPGILLFLEMIPSMLCASGNISNEFGIALDSPAHVVIVRSALLRISFFSELAPV